MADNGQDTSLGRVLDAAVRGLEPSPRPRLAEIRRRAARRRTRRWALSTTLVLALMAGLSWTVVSLTGGGHSGLPSTSSNSQPVVGPPPTPTPTVRGCRLARTSGDFDGDGTPDVAILAVIPRTGQSCRQAQYPHGAHPVHPNFRLELTFGSGGQWDRRFRYCTAGQCGATAFTATDLNGAGRAELAVDVGPGAAIDYVEFFRVDRDSFHPLRIAPTAALRKSHLKPGPAILGGGFDSGLQSPVSCQLRSDGTRMLLATHAELAGGNIHGPWRVARIEFQLRDDSLYALRVSTTTIRGFPITEPSFNLACP